MNSNFISNRWTSTGSSLMGDIAAAAAGIDDLIDFSIGDPDLTTDVRLINAAFEDAKNGYTHYGPARGMKDLIAAVQAFYKAEFNYDVPTNEIYITTSGIEGMTSACMSVLDPGDEVIIPEPYFSCYKDQVEMAGGVVRFLPTSAENGFKIDAAKLDAMITDKTKAFLFNNPNNPTGCLLSREDLEAIAEVCKKHNLLVLADDLYTLFSYSGPFVPIGTLPGMAERTVTVRTFSKDYCMTGWRIGYVIAPPQIIDVIAHVGGNMCYTAPSISQRAALYGLQHYKEVQPAIREEFLNRAKTACECINSKPYLSVSQPQGSIYLFPDITGTGLNSHDFAHHLVKKYHILMIPGCNFGPSGEGFERMALTVGCDAIRAAFERLPDTLEEFLA